MAVWCRVYVVTGRNNLVCSPLALLIVLQAAWGIILLIYFAWRAGASFDTRLVTPVDGHPVSQLPQEIFDLFGVCVFQLWATWTVAFFSTALAFGMLSPSNFYFWSSRSIILSQMSLPS
jgi:hypothetical protein